MPHKNIEFKARCADIAKAEEKLLKLNPEFKGEDNQVDTYYKVATGRLKMREGNIENALIYYERPDTGGAKLSNVVLYEHEPSGALKSILEKTHGILVTVKKCRRIFFIDNVKFHFDRVDGLGIFLEVEAIDSDGTLDENFLKNQCSTYAAYLEVKEEDYIFNSYSDMLMKL